MKKNPGHKDSAKEVADERRREFLRKSVYAAYATPVIMAILVEKASAKTGSLVWCERHQKFHPSPGH